MLSPRQKKVLKWIVEEYVRTAEPVGSKSLASLPDFGYSSATIRNDMAYLEELGLIIKTHSSSGRVPSELGYRLYVQDIIEHQEDSPSFPMIDEIFEQELISREQAIKESMALVTEITNYASLVLGSAAYRSKIKKLQFVKINDGLGVLLMVTDQGYVESKKIIIPDEIHAEDLDKVIAILNEILHDCPISQIDTILREKLNERNMDERIEYYDELVGILVSAFTKMAQDKYFLSGQTNILKQPEFQSVDKVRELLDVIEKQEILQVVDLNHTGITVKIGQENEIKAMEDCTVISISYENEMGERGAIAVIGPKRMEYQKVIPLLEYISKNLRKLS
ncbi:MAG: heat-inducible transcriptional repressor HrcA [Bacilli bacterium]|nr:heat-inducible transcriptional repressor HrcA [Bacilli bacterium]